MEEYPDIEFDADGNHYAARVFPRYQELEIYFEIHFHAPGKEQKTVFIEMNNSGEWVAKNGIKGYTNVSEEFIRVLGRQIENGS